MKNSKISKKQIKYKFVILGLILISLILASCSKGPDEVDIYTGTQGVTVQFSENNPPREMYEDSHVFVFAEIWNRGAYSITKEIDEPILISLNYDNIYFDAEYVNEQMTSNQGSFNYLEFYLSGKSAVWPIGEKTIVPIAKLNVNKIPGIRETPVTKIDISACYPYTTYFAQNICVDSDMYSMEKEPICKNLKVYNYASQGAPVIVSKLEVDMVPVGIRTGSTQLSVPVLNESGHLMGIEQGGEEFNNIILKPSFIIHFRNVDTGIIIASKSNENPCIKGASNEGEAFRINATLGNRQLICAKPEIKLYSNEGSVRCWLDNLENLNQETSSFELNRNYELPLKLEAEYFYKVTTTKEVRINRIS